MKRRPLADRALVGRALKTEIRSGFNVSDPELVPRQRRELVARCAVCAAGFVLAAAWGTLIPLTLSLFSGWDHFARRQRSVLVATESGLHLVRIRGQKARLITDWPLDAEARLVLNPGKPEVPLQLPGWAGVIHGADIERAERTIRDGGGDPVRVIQEA